MARTSAPRLPRLWVGNVGAAAAARRRRDRQRDERPGRPASSRRGGGSDGSWRRRVAATGRQSASRATSARRGGSAPARWQVRLGDLDRDLDGVADERRDRRVRAAEPALDPAGEEPAAERVARPDRVDDLDGRDRRRRTRTPRPTTWTVRPPSVRRTTAGPRPSSGRRGLGRRRARIEVGEVVGADLDDVGPGEDAVEPGEVGRTVAR